MMAPLAAYALVAFIAPPGTAPCPPCSEAEGLLVRGDTSAALTTLRRAVADEPGDATLQGELGLALARTAPLHERDFEQRLEAERALERALRDQPAHPRWLYGLALLRWKQGVHTDAVRLFERADIALYEADTAGFSPRELAELHLARGRLYERYARDFRGLVKGAALAADTADCGDECATDQLELSADRLRAAPREEESSDDAAASMRRHYEAAFRADAGFDEAAARLLGDLARTGEWQRFVEVAGRHVARTVGDGWALSYLAAGRWRTGAGAAAEDLFDEALARLPASERAVLENVAQSVLPENQERFLSGSGTSRTAWTRFMLRTSDPLFLTPINERRLEHFTRVVLAELWFDEPATGVRGAESDRGRILIRYGEPTLVRQVARGDTLASEDTGPVGVVGGVLLGGRSSVPGGRSIFWHYGADRPNFLFLRRLGRTRTRHSPASATHAERLRARQPSTFAFPVDPLPHQAARFLGDDAAAGDVVLDIYAALPADSLASDARAGVFFLPRTHQERLARAETRVRLAEEPRNATFRVPLEPGAYVYAVEALSDDERVRARSRARIDTAPFAGLALSDLLLARAVGPRVASPASRIDFRIAPAADLRYETGEPVALYFEVYGLAADTEGTSRYRVELEVEGDEGGGILARAARGLARALGLRQEDTRIVWERVVPGPPVRSPEWFRLELPDAEPGAYELVIRVTDLETGREVERTRRFEIVDQR